MGVVQFRVGWTGGAQERMLYSDWGKGHFTEINRGPVECVQATG